MKETDRADLEDIFRYVDHGTEIEDITIMNSDVCSPSLLS